VSLDINAPIAVSAYSLNSDEVVRIYAINHSYGLFTSSQNGATTAADNIGALMVRNLGSSNKSIEVYFESYPTRSGNYFISSGAGVRSSGYYTYAF
jgi:hypothetical protein